MRESADRPSSSQSQISALSHLDLVVLLAWILLLLCVCIISFSGLQKQRGWGGQWLQFYLVRGTGQLLPLPASEPVMKWKCWEGCLALGLLSAVQTDTVATLMEEWPFSGTWQQQQQQCYHLSASTIADPTKCQSAQQLNRQTCVFAVGLRGKHLCLCVKTTVKDNMKQETTDSFTLFSHSTFSTSGKLTWRKDKQCFNYA